VIRQRAYGPKFGCILKKMYEHSIFTGHDFKFEILNHDTNKIVTYTNLKMDEYKDKVSKMEETGAERKIVKTENNLFLVKDSYCVPAQRDFEYMKDLVVETTPKDITEEESIPIAVQFLTSNEFEELKSNLHKSTKEINKEL
jgi:hypothetical protein